MKEKFYVTTAIPYANAAPHIGHALEFVQADVIARWNRLIGKKVFFLTGTDEHGTKNFMTAKKLGLEPQEFVDKNVGYFKELLKLLNTSYDNFIRTTDKKEHWPGAEDIWNKLVEAGALEKKKYTGNYCSGCERFVTEKDLIEGKCPDHPTGEIETISDENYFLKLSKYSDEIKEKIESDELEIYPKKWKNNFLGLIKDGLQDVSFSRSKEQLSWGIPVPTDKDQVMYVWCDALTNYLTGIGYPDKKYKDFWPADVHVVGKDMLRFHTGIWPGMLLAAGIPLPKKVIVHGFLTINGKKMSKSTGNVVDPIEITKKYGADATRYILLRQTAFGDDGDFSEQALVDRCNNELMNKLGNLVSRVSGLVEKNGMEKENVEYDFSNVIRRTGELMESFKFDKALNRIFALIDEQNEYIQEKKPWETKDKKVLYELANAIKKISILLYPFIPETCEKIAEQFGGYDFTKKELEKDLDDKTKIKKGKHLFQKIELEAIDKTISREETKPNLNKSEEPEEIMEGVTTIQFEDFTKVELRVAEIKEAEDIEKADKLYKLTLDDGEDGRTICAGIKEFYSKEELVGKKIIIVANLAPRKMRGIESCGMLLAASNEDHSKVSLISPDKDIEAGSLVG